MPSILWSTNYFLKSLIVLKNKINEQIWPGKSVRTVGDRSEKSCSYNEVYTLEG